MAHLLRIQLLGEFRVHIGDRVITRFSTQKAGTLLAYLAFYPEPHPRQVLVEMLGRMSRRRSGAGASARLSPRCGGKWNRRECPRVG